MMVQLSRSFCSGLKKITKNIILMKLVHRKNYSSLEKKIRILSFQVFQLYLGLAQMERLFIIEPQKKVIEN